MSCKCECNHNHNHKRPAKGGYGQGDEDDIAYTDESEREKGFGSARPKVPVYDLDDIKNSLVSINRKIKLAARVIRASEKPHPLGNIGIKPPISRAFGKSVTREILCETQQDLAKLVSLLGEGHDLGEIS
ncbi:MAG: hypothetical protein WAQ98_11210 [Blastocatellia bacterium]